MCKGTKKIINNKYYPRFKIMYKHTYRERERCVLQRAITNVFYAGELRESFVPQRVHCSTIMSLMMEKDNVPFSIPGLLFFFLLYKNKNRKKFSFLFLFLFFFFFFFCSRFSVLISYWESIMQRTFFPVSWIQIQSDK
jgi:hypothetical protein